MDRFASALYLLVGLGNLLPVAGVLSAARLEALYGVAIGDPNLLVLMRHRAVLFAIVGVLLVAAAFRPAWRAASLAAGWASMLSFVTLAWLVGDVNAELRRVAAVDLALSAILACAAVVGVRSTRPA
jgi:hypothetical protein